MLFLVLLNKWPRLYSSLSTSTGRRQNWMKMMTTWLLLIGHFLEHLTPIFVPFWKKWGGRALLHSLVLHEKLCTLVAILQFLHTFLICSTTTITTSIWLFIFGSVDWFCKLVRVLMQLVEFDPWAIIMIKWTNVELYCIVKVYRLDESRKSLKTLVGVLSNWGGWDQGLGFS